MSRLDRTFAEITAALVAEQHVRHIGYKRDPQVLEQPFGRAGRTHVSRNVFRPVEAFDSGLMRLSKDACPARDYRN